ncbi:MAG: hypothetical protein KDI50_12090 [Candidatus Competibacteraceae bacterium]|nr:hypothetical protein [Candidatus Competibacteraceae bacterium]
MTEETLIQLKQRIEDALVELEELQECGDLDEVLEAAFRVGEMQDRYNRAIAAHRIEQSPR